MPREHPLNCNAVSTETVINLCKQEESAWRQVWRGAGLTASPALPAPWSDSNASAACLRCGAALD